MQLLFSYEGVLKQEGRGTFSEGFAPKLHELSRRYEPWQRANQKKKSKVTLAPLRS
jgi:hypothetical protein